MTIELLKKSYFKFLNNKFSIQKIIITERDNFFLWAPVIFALAIIFYFLNNGLGYIAPLLLLTLAIFCLFFCSNNHLEKYFYISIAIKVIIIFLLGFLWAKFYDINFIKSPIVKSNIYGQAEGKIESIKILENGNKSIILNNLIIKKADFTKKTQQNLIKKPIKNNNSTPKYLKINKNTKKSHLNIKGYAKIDRGLDKNYHYHHFENNILRNPPKKVKLTIRGKYNNINLDIGDFINTKILLQPIPKNNKISSFNFVQYYYFRQIGAIGFVIGEIKKLDQKELTKKDSLLNNIDIKIDYWRYQIADKINNNFKNKDNAAILNALLLGIRDFIPKDLMENIRIAGLAHLLAISGLHLSLAGYIFFIFFRLILSFSETIALKFNIKKIAAILAILSSFLYLLIAGTPIPALRAFFMVLIVFLAIIFDKNTNPLRSLAFAALIILIINPSSIFEISFQMSFTAILALISFYNIIDKKNNTENIINKNPIKKLLSYIIAISLSSTIAQIALAPLVIYYFNNYALLGIISNLVAIPLTTFIVMPISFIYLFSLNSILESPLRYILDIALNNIIKISEFVANIEFSNISISLISSKSLIIIVFGFLLLALSINKKIKYVAMLIILTGALNAYQTLIPDITIDKNRQFVAIYYNKKLFFSKKVRKSIRVNDLLKKTNMKDIKIWDELPRNIANCSYEMCKIKFKNKNILAILKRAKIKDICQEDYDILINITKFRLPECINYQKKIINNRDLKENGSYYLYLD